MPAKTVGDRSVGTLAAAGVKRIYGVVGDSLNGLTDAIRRHGQIDWIHVRHKEVAAFAAGAEAHLTGELAACACGCELGNLHLINGLFDCHRSRVPVLEIARMAHANGLRLEQDYVDVPCGRLLFRGCRRRTRGSDPKLSSFAKTPLAEIANAVTSGYAHQVVDLASPLTNRRQ